MFIENIEVDQYHRDIISHSFSFPQFHPSTDNVMPLPCPVSSVKIETGRKIISVFSR